MIELLVNWFNDLGFYIEILVVENSWDKYNLLVIYGEGEGGLLLVGYIDIVFFDEGKWMFNLFNVIEKEGKFYGLGMVDMKGFFVFIVDVVS